MDFKWIITLLVVSSVVISLAFWACLICIALKNML